jgi:hypothetical protein
MIIRDFALMVEPEILWSFFHGWLWYNRNFTEEIKELLVVGGSSYWFRFVLLQGSTFSVSLRLRYVLE